MDIVLACIGRKGYLIAVYVIQSSGLGQDCAHLVFATEDQKEDYIHLMNSVMDNTEVQTGLASSSLVLFDNSKISVE